MCFDSFSLQRNTEEDVVYAQWRSATHRPAFFIVRDTERKNIVLCIRGTLNAKDLLTDLCATAETWEGDEEEKEKEDVSTLRRILSKTSGTFNHGNQLRAHHGMTEGARGVAQLAREIVEKELASNPNFSLVIVGHSLGGGTAAVLGAMWKSIFPDLVVYAYGCPCVFPLDTDAYFHSCIISVVGMHDPFSTLSLGHLADISIALAQLCKDDELRTDAINRCKNRIQDMSEEDLMWSFNIMTSLRENMTSEKLYPPGRILLISGANENDNDGKVALHEVPQEKFQELALHPRMLDISRHVPNRYEDELRNLWDVYHRKKEDIMKDQELD